MIYPVKGSEEIQGAGDHPEKSSRGLLSQRESIRGTRAIHARGKRSKVGKEASSRSRKWLPEGRCVAAALSYCVYSFGSALTIKSLTIIVYSTGS